MSSATTQISTLCATILKRIDHIQKRILDLLDEDDDDSSLLSFQKRSSSKQIISLVDAGKKENPLERIEDVCRGLWLKIFEIQKLIKDKQTYEQEQTKLSDHPTRIKKDLLPKPTMPTDDVIVFNPIHPGRPIYIFVEDDEEFVLRKFVNVAILNMNTMDWPTHWKNVEDVKTNPPAYYVFLVDEIANATPALAKLSENEEEYSRAKILIVQNKDKTGSLQYQDKTILVYNKADILRNAQTTNTFFSNVVYQIMMQKWETPQTWITFYDSSKPCPNLSGCFSKSKSQRLLEVDMNHGENMFYREPLRSARIPRGQVVNMLVCVECDNPNESSLVDRNVRTMMINILRHTKKEIENLDGITYHNSFFWTIGRIILVFSMTTRTFTKEEKEKLENAFVGTDSFEFDGVLFAELKSMRGLNGGRSLFIVPQNVNEICRDISQFKGYREIEFYSVTYNTDSE